MNNDKRASADSIIAATNKAKQSKHKNVNWGIVHGLYI